ncbi:hypothetical protein PB2503_09244 [Parvularcula bermudensis HTCC2503]|uniref:Response regulatory domain-containing protein n=1 Tax=Parvularcula bermudensis (strain ATCC BAA-594 / HTCC2503 / KCTC 12087) TaxID=314260 RepID=E0TD79_PARBH|nr:response regulator [Parvularcula bermudensis]ADM09902.1 hypothetical protein PB2503_09244 [Parvularcula bermudensis HTCC2503]
MAYSGFFHARPGPPQTLLLVEDDPLLAAAVIQYAEEEGYAVDGPYTRSSEAEAAIAAHSPTAALIDYRLADGDRGDAVARLLHRQAIPFALVTASEDHEVKGLCTQYGCQMVRKPVDDRVLDETFDFLMTGPAAHQAMTGD